jgi:flagellar basal body-associated protein FliL
MTQEQKARLKIDFFSAWWEALLSPGLAPKLAALLVVAGSVGASYVLVIGAKRGIYQWKHRPEALSRAAQEEKQLTEFLARQAEDSKEKVSTVELGQFTVEVHPSSDAEARSPRGVSNMAEMKISIRCEDRDTREFITTHPVQVKNAVTGVFVQLDREDLLTTDGKTRIKHRILEKLNTWLETEHVHGRIEDVYFPSLIVN